MLSASWSDAPARAIVEADRVLLYLLVMVFVAMAARNRHAAGDLAGWMAVAVVVVCGAGLLARTAPDLVHGGMDVHRARLSYPITYWLNR